MGNNLGTPSQGFNLEDGLICFAPLEPDASSGGFVMTKTNAKLVVFRTKRRFAVWWRTAAVERFESDDERQKRQVEVLKD